MIIQFQMIVTLIDPFATNQDAPKGSIHISINQFSRLNRASILKYLWKHQNISEDQAAKSGIITTQPRDFFLDLLLNRDADIYYEEEQIEEGDTFKAKRFIKCPLNLLVYKFQEEFLIDCQSDAITINHFETIQKIGEGTYSQIFLVQRKYDRHLFCMKRINKAECRQKGHLQMIKNQFQILQYSSKYKIKLYYQFQDPKYVYFILDYCPFGDLYSVIRNNKKVEQNSRLTLTQKYNIWIQIAFGIVSLHERGLIYRDLKPENILIDQNQRIRICDFGFTCKLQPNEKLSSLCGSYQYLAPEMVKQQGYNKSLDLYCLGLLFYQLLIGSSPYEGITPKNLIDMKSRAINLEKKAISITVKDLIKKLVKEKPEERLGYESSMQIFRHQFFKQNQDLIHKIIHGKAYIKNIKYIPPARLQERPEMNQVQALIFDKGVAFNYLKPFFDVTENVGPKFQSNI